MGKVGRKRIHRYFLGGVLAIEEKVLEFKCVPERLVFNTDEFKIYGCSVNSFEYPDVQLNQYSMVTIKGNIQELNLGVEYSVKAREVSDKFGIGYQVIHIKRDKPTTIAATRNFLYEILTPMQTDTLLEVYPDIVDRIMKNKPVDLSKTKGIKDYTFNVIKQKVIENFKLADLVEEFKGLFSLSVIKKIYDKYTSVEKVKEVIREEPYECLCKLSGIGFKTADSLLLELERESSESKSKGEKPILFFNYDLKPSYQRAKACVDYLLTENETNGNTYIPVGELKKEFEILVPEAITNLAPILKGDNDVVFDRESLMVCKKLAYDTEHYIASSIKKGLLIERKWDYELKPFEKLEDFDLTSEQSQTMNNVYKYSISLLVGYAGCVDCDTEFFNGIEWKKISEYKKGDRVLQYNMDGTAELVSPLDYIKNQKDYLWHFETKYGLDQCLSENHNCVIRTMKGVIKKEKFESLMQRHKEYNFKDKFITTFNYSGNGIDIGDDMLRLLIAVSADGHFADGNGCRVRFNLKKHRKIARLVSLLNKMNKEYDIKNYNGQARDYIQIMITIPESYSFFKEFPRDWYKCSGRQKAIIAEEIMYWDGSYKEKDKYFTTIKANADFIQFVFNSLGKRASIKVDDRVGCEQHSSNGKVYRRKSIGYEVCVTERVYLGLHNDKRGIGGNRKDNGLTPITKYKTIDGYEYCFSVPSEMLVLRRNDKIFITGNSGKSASSKALINALESHNKSYLLLAPTGRAAKVLSGYTKRNAMTIHRGLGYNPKEGWLHNEENPLTQEVVVVDEFSMTDIYLFATLLRAIDFGKTKLLLIGDDAQIPSVSAGNVLYDLLKWNGIPTVRLEKIFRYGSGGVLTVATDIRESKEYLAKVSDSQVFGDDKSYTFLPATQDKIIKYMVGLYKKLLASGKNPEDILVLSAYNVGDYGTLAINKILQNIVNPNPEKKITFGESEFRLNDIVMCVQNDYQAVRYNKEWINEKDTAFIANGESGKVIDITHNAMVVKYEDETIYYMKSNLKILRLSYCYSIHKSQGGNSEITLILTPKAHTFMLNSNLLYVGVTRTRGKCYHIGEVPTISRAIKKKENFDRRTMLQMFLKKEDVELDDGQSREKACV